MNPFRTFDSRWRHCPECGSDMVASALRMPAGEPTRKRYECEYCNYTEQEVADAR